MDIFINHLSKKNN